MYSRRRPPRPLCCPGIPWPGGTPWARRRCQRHFKMSFFAEMECRFLQGSIQVLYSLIHHITCRFEARQALIYQLVSGLTGENGKYNYSKAVHLYPPFFDIFCSPKNYKTASALTGVIGRLKALCGFGSPVHVLRLLLRLVRHGVRAGRYCVCHVLSSFHWINEGGRGKVTLCRKFFQVSGEMSRAGRGFPCPALSGLG